MDYNHIKKTSKQLDDREQKYMEQYFPTSQVYKGLGLTRDALRYYEELGILTPGKNEENSYREYSLDDIWSILAIDYYKKRGVTPKELKRLKEGNDQQQYKELLLDKKSQIEDNIKYQQRMLKKLNETIAFNKVMETKLGVFEVKEFPLYELEEEFSSIANFEEYREKILEHINVSQEDIYSNMVKVLMVDDNGYTGSKGYFIKKASRKKKGREYLESGKALYAAIEDNGNEDDKIMERMFISCMKWAEEHRKKFKGMVYIQPKFICWSDDGVKSYLECWVPLEN